MAIIPENIPVCNTLPTIEAQKVRRVFGWSDCLAPLHQCFPLLKDAGEAGEDHDGGNDVRDEVRDALRQVHPPPEAQAAAIKNTAAVRGSILGKH